MWKERNLADFKPNLVYLSIKCIQIPKGIGRDIIIKPNNETFIMQIILTWNLRGYFSVTVEAKLRGDQRTYRPSRSHNYESVQLYPE